MNSSPTPAGLALLALTAVWVLDTCTALEGQDSSGENFKFELRLLREDFQEERTKLRRNLFSESQRRIKLEKQLLKHEEIIRQLQTIVSQLETDRAFPRGSPSKVRPIINGLTAQKMITKQTEEDLRQLKATVSGNSDRISSLQQSASQNYTELRTSLLDLRESQSLCTCSTRGQQIEPGERSSREITVPQLRFIQTDDPAVIIDEDGVILKERMYSSLTGTCVSTDGRLMTALQYWEVEVTWYALSSYIYTWQSVGSVGVRQQGSDFSRRLGSDDQSWAVSISYWYSFKQIKWKYQYWHGSEPSFETTPVNFKDKRPPNRLGFFLDVPEQTLTVVDVNNNNHTFSFSGVNVSRPLVPAVGFGDNGFMRSFRLLPVDPSSLPKPVRAQSLRIGLTTG